MYRNVQKKIQSMEKQFDACTLYSNIIIFMYRNVQNKIQSIEGQFDACKLYTVLYCTVLYCKLYCTNIIKLYSVQFNNICVQECTVIL